MPGKSDRMSYISELTCVITAMGFFLRLETRTARCFLNFIMGTEEIKQNISVINVKMIDPVYDTERDCKAGMFFMPTHFQMTHQASALGYLERAPRPWL